jgi:hypothetical protein
MWTFESSTGDIIDAKGNVVWHGYAGHGSGLNNPAMQDIHGIGPLPEGLYSMAAPVDHPRVGRFAIQLTPHAENKMFGRSGFFIHGDRIGSEGLFLASDGCIIAIRWVRELMYASGDHVLRVVAVLTRHIPLALS